MKVKELIEKLQQYPEDMEVLIDWDPIYDGEIIVTKKDLYHCNCTSKFQSNFDFYSEYDEPCVYKDEVGGKIVEIKVPTEKKEFVILDC